MKTDFLSSNSKLVRLVMALPLLFILACSAEIKTDLRDEYNKAVRGMGLTPVYPPKEEFQVGDVYFYAYDTSQEENLEVSQGTWVATLPVVREAANEYLRSRINFESTSADTVGFRTNDLTSGTVVLNESARQTLPLVSFPSVSASASTAGSLGGYGFAQSFGLGFGLSEQVHVNFHDTRAYGVPFNSQEVIGKIVPRLRAEICTKEDEPFEKLQAIVNTLEFLERSNRDKSPTLECKSGAKPGTKNCKRDQALSDKWCDSEDRECGFYVVTRTILTRQISFSYTSAQIFELALANAGEPGTKTVPVPSTFNVNLNLGPGANEQQVETLRTALSSAVQAGEQSSESSGLRFAGIQGDRMVFERKFVKPVPIAYESFFWTMNDLISGGFCSIR